MEHGCIVVVDDGSVMMIDMVMVQDGDLVIYACRCTLHSPLENNYSSTRPSAGDIKTNSAVKCEDT